MNVIVVLYISHISKEIDFFLFNYSCMNASHLELNDVKNFYKFFYCYQSNDCINVSYKWRHIRHPIVSVHTFILHNVFNAHTIV